MNKCMIMQVFRANRIITPKWPILLSISAFFISFMSTNIGATTVGDAVASKSEKARLQFEQGHFDEALSLYRDAQLERPDSPLLHFNIGDALYKKGDYDAALQEFTSALQGDDKELKAKTMYNMGNVHAQQEAWTEAVEAYKQALYLNEQDQDTKANLELALQRLEEQQQQQQQQDGEDSEDKQKQQEKEESQPQQDEDQSQKTEQNNSDDKEQQEAQNNQRDQEDEQQDQAQSEEGEPEEEDGQDQPLSTAMEEAEAEQLLNALKDREQEAQRRRFKTTRATRGKDW